MDQGHILPKTSAGMLQQVSPMTPHTEPVWRGALSRPRWVSGCRVEGRVGSSGAHSSAVDWGMRSGILESFRLEHSTTLASQRHLWGQATSLVHSLFRW